MPKSDICRVCRIVLHTDQLTRLLDGSYACGDHVEPEWIADKWANKLGLGWHPNTRGREYINILTKRRFLSNKETAEYERDMWRLSTFGDSYEFALAAWGRAGLL